MSSANQPLTTDPHLIFVQSINTSIADIIFKQQKVPLTHCTETILTGAETKLAPGIASSISVVCPQFTGTVILGFSTPLFLTLIHRMLGEVQTAISPDYQDLAAEFLNIIFGHAKNAFNKRAGTTITPAIPAIIAGDDLKFALVKDTTSWEARFQSANGELISVVSLSKSK